MTAVELAQAIKKRRLGAEELTRFYLELIERLDGQNGLNAVAELNENAIMEARRIDSAIHI